MMARRIRRVAADADARHQDALLDLAEAVDPHVLAEHAARDPAARDDAAGRNDRVERLPAASALSAKTNLAGGACG